MDRITPERRSWNMSRIRGRDTNPEKIVRSLLHRMGYRFRLHRADLPGKPDIVLPKYKTVIFVHGCFWHMHRCKNGRVVPKTNTEFWSRKRRETVQRDSRKNRVLRRSGWRVLVIWECKTLHPSLLSSDLKTLLASPRLPQPQFTPGRRRRQKITKT